MNHELLLSLELLEQASWGYRFRLLARNQSSVKLLLPFPEVIGLRFAAASSAKEAEWYTTLLVSPAGGGFTLDLAASRAFEWKVRPCSIEQFEPDGTFPTIQIIAADASNFFRKNTMFGIAGGWTRSPLNPTRTCVSKTWNTVPRASRRWSGKVKRLSIVCA